MKQPWDQKGMFWAFGKGNFQGFFAIFMSDEVENIFSESKAKHQKLFNQNLVIGTFLENGFEASLSSRANIVSVWK